jgi:hypothetical protein
MTVAGEIAAYLEAQGLGKQAVDLFIGKMPATPEACGVVYEYGGAPAELGFGVDGIQFETPGIQVAFRGAPHDYAGPRAKAELAFRALPKVQATNLSGAFYLTITPQQSPFALERDDDERHVVVCNFLCEKRPSP